MTSVGLSNTAVKVAAAPTLPTVPKPPAAAPVVPVLTEVASRLVAVEKRVAALEAGSAAAAPAQASGSSSGGLPFDKLFYGGQGILDDVKNVFGLDTSGVDVAPPMNVPAAAPAAPTAPAAPVAPAAAAPAEPTITAPHLETTMEAMSKGPNQVGGKNKISRGNIQMARRHTRRHRRGRKGTRRNARRQNK